jgi:predicted amidohydrolase YtcJ
VVRDGRLVALPGGGAVASHDTAPHDTAPDVPAVALPPGAVVTGAFVDHHLHLLAAAARRWSVDLSAARSLTDVFDLLGDAVRAGGTDGGWLRAWGIDESELAERRLPTPEELERVAGGRPLVVHHRTGHVELRTAAAQHGRAPTPDRGRIAEAVEALGRDLAAAGVVAVTDATHTNDRAALGLLGTLPLPQAVTAMVGWDRLDGVVAGATVDGVTVGPAKVMPPACGLDGVGDAIARAHDAGFAVALHAVDVDELQAGLDGGLRPGDRVEHLGLCLPEHLDELARRRITVVTQPAFVTRRAAKYRQELSEVELGWLYRLRTLLEAGVEVRLSSDAPVVPPRPLEAVAAAVGRTLGRSERIDVDSALRLAARPLTVGAPADLVVLGADPRTAEPEQLADLPVLAVWRAGRLVHGDARRWPEAP